jgi:drug/metabolite transporter (DMT)-like permease
MNKNTFITRYLLLLIVSFIWGSQFVLNKIAIQAFPPMVISTARPVLAALLMSILLLKENRSKNNSTDLGNVSLFIPYCFIAVFEAIIPLVTIVWGQKYVPSNITAVLLGMMPIFVSTLAIIVREEIMTIRKVIAIMVGFIGLLVLMSPDFRHQNANILLGEASILAGGFSFAISVIIIRKMPMAISPTRLTRNIFMIAAIPMIIYSCLRYDLSNLQFDWSAILSVLALGLICTGIVYIFYISLIRIAGVTFAAMCNYLVPVIGFILGSVLLHEAIKINAIIALVMISSSFIIYEMAAKLERN